MWGIFFSYEKWRSSEKVMVKIQEIDKHLLKRKVAKTILYRILNIIAFSLMINYFFIPDLLEAFMFAILLEGLKTIGYFTFEFLWEGIKRFWNWLRK